MSQLSSANSENQIFSNSKTSDAMDGNILRYNKKTYSKGDKSCNSLSGNDELSFSNSSFSNENEERLLVNSKSTINTQNVPSSSLASIKNDFKLNDIDGNVHTDSKKTLESKPISEDPLHSLFGNEEDKDCDSSDEDFSPIFEYKSKRIRKNLKRQVVEKKLNLDEPQQSPVTLSMSNNVKLNGAKLKTTGKSKIESGNIEANFYNHNEQFTLKSRNGMDVLEFVQKYSEENEASFRRGKFEYFERFEKLLKTKRSKAKKSRTNETNSAPKNSVKKIVPKSTEVKKCHYKNNLPKNEDVIEKSTTAHTHTQCKLDSQTSFQNKVSESTNVMKCNNIENNCIEKSISVSIQNKSNCINNGHCKKPTMNCNKKEVVANISSKHAIFSSSEDEYKNAERMGLNSDDFKQIKISDVADIDKNSTRKPSQESCDKLNSESFVPHSFPPQQLSTESPESSDSDEDLLECDQVIHNETNVSNDFEATMEDLMNEMESNCFLTFLVDHEDTLKNPKLENITVENLCDSPGLFSVLSKYCGKSSFLDIQPERNTKIELSPENFPKLSALNVVKDFVKRTISGMFSLQALKSRKFLKDTIVEYAYEKMDFKECVYMTRMFNKPEFVTLDALVVKLTVVGMMLMFDKFKMVKQHYDMYL